MKGLDTFIKENLGYATELEAYHTEAIQVVSSNDLQYSFSIASLNQFAGPDYYEWVSKEIDKQVDSCFFESEINLLEALRKLAFKKCKGFELNNTEVKIWDELINRLYLV